ncbi:MAG: RsmB/NOP family class I SAM-dependent RNA methyltransferase [Pseudomonadota bacterium]
MTPAARHAAAIEVLERWVEGEVGLDRVLTAWGRSHRFAGSGDRHAIADIVHGVLRRARALQWLGRGGDAGSTLGAFRPRTAVLTHAVLAGFEPEAIAGADRHAPPSLSAAEAAALARLGADGAEVCLADAPLGVRVSLPDWLLDRLSDVPEKSLAVLGERAPVDLRVNTLKSSPEVAATALAAEGVETAAGPLAATCLRVKEGARRVARSAAYRDGLVELQDAASQAVVERAGAAPGMVVLDFCAGGGGKTLALAAAMGGPQPSDGRLIAHDAAPLRMADLAPRAARAGARVETMASGARDALTGQCDLVLTDVPCSGSGAWRRNPDARWRLTQTRLEALCATQAQILIEAAPLVRPGGRLVYVTCSIIADENDAAVTKFLTERPDFAKIQNSCFSTLPDRHGGDGFFSISLARSP